jgi:soluble lytic murein transglycosylase
LPTVPVPERHVTHEALPGTTFQPANFGAGTQMVGRALEGLGSQLSEGADALERIQETEAQAAAMEQDNASTAEKQEALYGDGGFFTLQGKAAMDAYPQIQEKFRKIDQDAVGRLQGRQMAQRMYERISTRRNTDLAPKLMEHRFQQANAYFDQVDKDSIEQTINGAVNGAGDEDEIGRQIATGETVIDNQLARKGMADPTVATEQKLAYRSRLVASVADRLNLSAGAEAAQNFVIKHAALIDPTEATKMLHALESDAREEWADRSVDGYLVHPTAEATGEAPADGKPTPSPKPADAALVAAVGGVESGNRDVDEHGRVVTSSAGAKGQMQVLDSTNGDPGYGVAPAKDNSLAERARVGRDYLLALKKHYGNVTVALTAYNQGPGKVDQWLKELGDPRRGEISEAAWLQKLPTQEGRAYAPAVLRRLGTQPATSGVSPSTRDVPSTRDEVDLQATFDAIDKDPELNFRDKEALKTAATRKHALVKQANDEHEQRIGDAAWGAVASLGNSFTDINQLPPSIRTELTGQQILTLTNKAQSNASDAAYAAIEPLGTNFTDPGQIPSRVWEGLDPRQKIELRSLAGRNAKAVGEARFVAERLASGGPLDPKDERIKNAVNEDYKAKLQQLRQGPHNSEDTLRFVSNYVDRVGFVPPSLQGGIRQNLRSADPNMQMAGARILRAITAKNPNLLKDFAEDDIARGVQINHYVDAGMKPEEAIQKAEEDGRITAAQRTARAEQYGLLSAKKERMNAPKIVAAAFGSDVSGTTAIGSGGAQLVADFEDLRRDEFIRTGDMEEANAAALQLVKRHWGVTGVNGKAEIVKYPPERYYGALGDPAKDAKWIHEQAVGDLLGENGIQEPDAPDRLRLIPHPTVAPINGEPVYAGVLRQKDGSYVTMIDERGRPRVFVPDFSTSKEADRQKRREREAIARAREMRDHPQLEGDVNTFAVPAP